SEKALLRLLTENGPLPADRRWQTEFLIVDKEEGLVASIEAERAEELLRQPDRAAHPKAVLIEHHPIARRFAGPWVGREVAVIEPVVGIQNRVAMIFVEAAVKVVLTPAGDKFDLDCTLAGTISPRCGGRDCNFFNGVQTWVDATVETI